LNPADLSQFSQVSNYINHPSAYYLLLAPWAEAGPRALRLANVGLTVLALALMLCAGARMLEPQAFPWFALAAAACPKAMSIGGMINNDVLAMLAAALLLLAWSTRRHTAWLLGLALALAGWTKLTALIALAALASLWLLTCRTRDLRLWISTVAGAALGALPYLVNLVRDGALLFRDPAKWSVPLDARINLTPLEFLAHFADLLLRKWPAIENSLPLGVVAFCLVIPILAVLAVRTAVRPLGLALAGAVVITLAIHLGFAWRAYTTLGDLTNAQARYYTVFWPAFALLLAAALGATKSPARWLVLPALLLPTLPVGLLLA
jgi:hypothetical protein